jgi:glycosyltransferase involved in cell wall biosynthesis
LTSSPSDKVDGNLPQLSVVVPSFNQGQFIERTIKSIISQNYPNLEIIVMDGGSTDETLSIIDRYRAHIAHFESGPDGGQAAAIAKGFLLARGDFISWLNSDDTYNPDALLAIGRYLALHPKVEFLYGNTRIIDANDRQLSFKRSVKFWLPVMKYAYLTVPQMSAFWSRALYLRAGGMDQTLRFCMDYDLFVRMSQISAPRRINETIGNFRIHGASKTTNLEKVRLREDSIVQERYCAIKPSMGWQFKFMRSLMLVALICLMAAGGGLTGRVGDKLFARTGMGGAR